MNKIKGSEMNQGFCANCPMRCMAEAQPNSVFARIHRWHSAMRRNQAQASARKSAAASKA